MTVKRFTRIICSNDEYTGSLYCNDDPLKIEEVCNLLNELHEENIRLKRDFDSCSHNRVLMYDEAKGKVEALTKENWELKQENETLENLTKGNNIGKVEMMDKEVTVDLNELDINIQKEIIFKSGLNKWIEKKMDYYERIIEKTDGYNNVSAKGHLDMLIVLKEWIKQR